MPDCKECKDNREKFAPVPHWAYEVEQAHRERTERRLWVVIIILIAALIATNAGWIWHESQHEDVVTTTQEVTQDAENGVNHFIGGDYYGTSDGKNDHHQKESS